MKFKDLWIKPSEEESNKPDDQPAEAEAPVQRQPQMPADAAAIAPFVQQLEDALQKSNLPSQQDYLDFIKALHNMESLPMDEGTKFKAAFATLQSFGCDLNQLLESVDYYNGILEGERDKFDDALRATVGETVLDKEKKVKRLTDENLADTAEIQKLTTAIEKNQQEITQLQQELAEINGKLKRQEESFTAAFNEMKERLRTDVAKMKTYLGPVVAAQATGNSRKK
jgi:hypothetical protein